MGRQSNPITPHGTWLELSWSKFNWTVYFFAGCISIRFITCIQIKSFSGCFIFLHLSTLPRSDFPLTHEQKKLPTCFVLSARTTKFIFFYVFFRGICKPCNEPETSADWTHKYQKMTLDYYPFFVLNIPLFTILTFSTFSYRNFFVCFDILWQLATTHALDNTLDRDANSSRQNDITWCDFLQGKQVELSLAFLLPQKT